MSLVGCGLPLELDGIVWVEFGGSESLRWRHFSSRTTVAIISMIIDAIEKAGGILIVTADHGNAEDMVKRNPKTGQPLLDKSGNVQILTSHTCCPLSL